MSLNSIVEVKTSLTAPKVEGYLKDGLPEEGFEIAIKGLIKEAGVPTDAFGIDYPQNGAGFSAKIIFKEPGWSLEARIPAFRGVRVFRGELVGHGETKAEAAANLLKIFLDPGRMILREHRNSYQVGSARFRVSSGRPDFKVLANG